MKRYGGLLRRLPAMVLAACPCGLSTGCATMAHRSAYDYKGKDTVTSCNRPGTPCPWLIGDGLLLLPGIVPGVIAFVVDFSTGAWRHDDFPTPAPPEAVAQTSEAQDR